MIDILFLPISSIQIDLVQVFYDLIIAILTGYIVWYKTDEYMLRRDERHGYMQEQQALSRFLGHLKLLAETVGTNPRVARTEIKIALLEEQPREYFLPQNEEQQEVFHDIAQHQETLERLVEAESVTKPEIDSIVSKLTKDRIAILSFRCNQPRVCPFKLWGPRSTAQSSRNK